MPTAIEQGFEVEAYTWNAFFLPKGKPDAIVRKLNHATVEAMKTPTVREKLESAGLKFVSADRTTPEYLEKFVASEIRQMGGADRGQRGQRRLKEAPLAAVNRRSVSVAKTAAAVYQERQLTPVDHGTALDPNPPPQSPLSKFSPAAGSRFRLYG